MIVGHLFNGQPPAYRAFHAQGFRPPTFGGQVDPVRRLKGLEFTHLGLALGAAFGEEFHVCMVCPPLRDAASGRRMPEEANAYAGLSACTDNPRSVAHPAPSLTTSDPVGPTTARAQQRATRSAFFIAGFGTASWAPLVPLARLRCGLDDAALGLLLLCLGIGSLLAMPLAGALAARHGCRRLLVAAALAMCAALPVLALAQTVAGLALALFVFGAAVGTLDCVANVQAVIVERGAGRPMMSGFHGLYSLGGMAGAGGVSGLLVWGLGAAPAMAEVVTIVAAVLALSARSFLGCIARPGDTHSRYAWPRGIVLFIGLLCCIVFLAEGAMLDWSAVLMVGVQGVDSASAGFAYAAFAASMTLVRLFGDALVARMRTRNVLRFGALCAASGVVLATLAPWWQLALVGYALVGAGCANIVPVLYTAVGRQRLMPESVAVPAVSTLGYAGILAGPALIGAAAHLTSLATAFLGVGLLLVFVAMSGAWLDTAEE